MLVKKICCIGAGYVGGPTMAVIAKKNPNIRVTVVDINKDRIDAWNSSDLSNLPIYEPGLADIVKETRNKNLFFSTNIDTAIDESEMIFISVNTPTKTYGKGKGMAADLKYIELCARNIAAVAKTDKIVVEKSTLPVRTAEAIKNILHNTGNGIDFKILSNPEFLAEGTAIQDLLNPDRVLIGGESESAIESLTQIYGTWVSRDKILRTNVWSSELSKLTANAFLVQRVSSINAISELCEQADYWEQVVIMNGHQKRRFSDRLIKTLYNTVSGKKTGMLGWAFKKDTNDTRESPAIYVADHLLNEQASISVYDPKVSESRVHEDLNYLNTRSEEENANYVKAESFPYEALDGAHVVTIMTEWNEYKTYDWNKIYDKMKKPAFNFDGRNILDKSEMNKIGFQYYAIGQ